MMVGFEDAQLLDITGPYATLAAANDLDPARPAYRLELIAERAGPLYTSAGLSVIADAGFHELGAGGLKRLHTLIAVGGEGTERAYRDDRLIAFIRRAAKTAERVASVCTGSFLLAKAGLLDGRRATTHWASCAQLRKLHPNITVEENAIFVRDGNLWTSAGVTAGMDLALALIAEDLGREAALKIARRLVLFMMRPGGQAQFSTVLETQRHGNGRLGDVIAWMREHPAADLSIPRLAARAKMSERTFARAFRAEAGDTPARFVERLRVEAARIALSQGGCAVERAALAAGFGSAERMRRAFHRHLGVSPSDFQARFGPRKGDKSDEEDRHSYL